MLAALVVAGAAPQRSLAAESSLLRSLFGPTFVRAEVIVQEGDAVRDLRIDRGRIRSIGARQLRLLERDGTLLSMPVSMTAAITTKGARSTFGELRAGMNVTTVRIREEPAHYVVQPALVLPKELAAQLFGELMIRAEVVLRVGTLDRDVRVDHGLIVAVRPRVVRIKEHDGRIVAFKVAAGARITLDGRSAQWGWLRAGMSATILRDGDAPATIVEASAAGR